MHSKEKIMNEQQKFEKRKQRTKIILITISVLFMIVMLVLPLFSVITNSLSEGFKFYVSSISTEYVRSALFVTILATLVAVTMGASGFTIFRKITLPQMKWGLIYGIILCSARALGEFGAVNALSKTRGETFTLPLEIDALYMSGTTSSITAAFAVSSVLVLIAVVVLILRNIAWYRSQDKQQGKDGR